MKVQLKTRVQVRIGDMGAGEAFTSNGSLFMVVDLYLGDTFKDSAESLLRDDLDVIVYVVNLESGIVTAFPNNIVVDVVDVEVMEI